MSLVPRMFRLALVSTCTGSLGVPRLRSGWRQLPLGSPALGLALAGNNKGVLDGLLLEADHLGEAQAREQLHVEDLLHRGLELQEGLNPAAAQVHDADAALQLIPVR